MPFEASVTPDITEGLPTTLSRTTEASASLKRGQVHWDISINGIGLNLGINDQNPYMRESAQVQKQQLDTSYEAGEQTLDSGYWIRSQTSWHLGAGANFYEPGSVNRYSNSTITQYRYATSVGVDVWDEGNLTLLKAAPLAQSASTSESYACSARAGGTDYFFTQTDGTLKRYDASGASVSYTPTGGTPGGRPIVAGSKVLVGCTSFGIDVGDVTGSALSRLYTQALGTTPKPYWAKGRLIATRGRNVFELALDGSSGGTPGNLDTVTALFTHPDTGWTWTGVSEAPDAILAAGYSGGGISAVYSFTLETDSSGTTPKLGQPFQVLELPPGEEILAIRVYLGTYVGIGTSKGLRVGLIGQSGKIQVGPLLFETPVTALGARASFLYAGVSNAIDGKSGAARVDLANPIGNDLLFPWAWDAQTHDTGTVNSVAFVGNTDRAVVAVGSKGVYAQSATVYEPSGYLTSGAVRYGTTESKAFRWADVRCATAGGESVGLEFLDSDASATPIVTLSAGASGANLSLARVSQRLEYGSYRVTLTRSTDTLSSPVVQSVALKAVPVVQKQRMIQYPVMLQDKTQDGRRTPVYTDVAKKLIALESLENDSAVVTVEDYRLGESFPATIESIQFKSTTPSTGSKTRGQDNVGGRLTITVRRVSG